MAKRNTQSTNTDDDSTTSSVSSPSSSSQSSGPFSGSQSTGTKKSTSILLIAAIVIIVAIVVVVIYYAITSLGSGSQQTGTQVLNNLSTNSSLNQTQTMFINDLKKSEALTSLHVTYYSANNTNYIPQPGNYSIAITNNQTVNSYSMGNYNRTDLENIVAYTNTKTGVVVAENVTSLEYYNSNATIICLNTTTYSEGLVTNASLQCQSGDAGQSYVEQFPFTAANVSSLAFLATNGNLTYSGTKTILGRTCDYFVSSNETSGNLLTNYTAIEMCLDTQYGIPLYFNATVVSGGIPNSTVYTATYFSTNTTASDFIIPKAYLDNESNPII